MVYYDCKQSVIGDCWFIEGLTQNFIWTTSTQCWVDAEGSDFNHCMTSEFLSHFHINWHYLPIDGINIQRTKDLEFKIFILSLFCSWRRKTFIIILNNCFPKSGSIQNTAPERCTWFHTHGIRRLLLLLNGRFCFFELQLNVKAWRQHVLSEWSSQFQPFYNGDILSLVLETITDQRNRRVRTLISDA